MPDKQNDSLQIDPELFADFLAESLEILDGLDPLFVQLEAHPEDSDIVDQIFRPVHSIKGNSAFFGLLNLKNFSHEMESVLQDVRSGNQAITPPLVSALLRGVDLLRAMLQRFHAGDLTTDYLPEEEAYLAELEAVAAGGENRVAQLAQTVRAALGQLASDPEKAAEQIGPLTRQVETLLQAVLPSSVAATEPTGDELLFRVDGTMVTEAVRTVAQFVRGMPASSTDEQKCEAFTAALKEIESVARKAERKSLVDNIGALQTDFHAIHDSGIGFDDLLADLIQEKFETMMRGIEVCDPKTNLCTLGGETTGPLEERRKPRTETPAPKEAKTTASESEAAGSKTLRIAEEKVDSFMNYVGELIIASEVFAYLQKRYEAYPDLRQITQEFKNANITFNELSTQLQRSLMAVRRIPVRTMTQKLPRIVRDTAAQLGKEIDFQLEGGDVQVDKSILEKLESPLVHMVRNSVDHGVETVEDRAAAGKPPQGSVVVRAESDEETLSLTIRDDGKGLDVEAIKAKAVEKGTITSEQADAMPDSEAFMLIFGAGVSTAKAVTDISGRGVGMDVVMNSIRELNGQIEVDSALGQGTTVTITLPMSLTLLVVDGLVGKIGSHEYIVPLADVRESIRPGADQVQTVTGRGEMIAVRGELYPLLRLHEMLAIAGARTAPEDCTIVVVETEDGSVGLMVDDIIGQQSVVLKDISGYFEGLEVLRGAAILGDGRVGLVLDTEGVVAACNR